MECRATSQNAMLRRMGFKIHSRPANGEPVWERGGRKYPQSKAVQIAEAEIASVEKQGAKTK